MKHLDNSELIALCLDTYDDFWSNPIFIELLEIAKRLDSVIETLNSIDSKHKVTGIRRDYRKLQKDNPAYNNFLRLPKNEAEAFLYNLDRKKLQKFFIDLSYEKSLLKDMPFKKNLHALLVDANYHIANYNRKPISFGIDPNYPTKQAYHPRTYQHTDEE